LSIETRIGQRKQLTILRILAEIGDTAWNGIAFLPYTGTFEYGDAKEWIEGRGCARIGGWDQCAADPCGAVAGCFDPGQIRFKGGTTIVGPVVGTRRRASEADRR